MWLSNHCAVHLKPIQNNIELFCNVIEKQKFWKSQWLFFFSVAAKLRQGRARQLCSQVKGKAFLKALISSVLASKKTHSKIRIYDWKISSFYRQALCFNNSTLVHWVLDLQKYHFYLKIASLYMLSPFFQRLQFAKKKQNQKTKTQHSLWGLVLFPLLRVEIAIHPPAAKNKGALIHVHFSFSFAVFRIRIVSV